MGFDQDYSMFAPKPRDDNLHLLAIVMHKDGAAEIWRYPRMEELDLLTRMQKERYRKFGHDNIASPGFKAFCAGSGSLHCSSNEQFEQSSRACFALKIFCTRPTTSFRNWQASTSSVLPDDVDQLFC